MTAAGLTLSAEELATAFPFHFAVDRSWQVIQFGEKLPRICPRIALGIPASSALRLVRPEITFDWSSVSRHLHTLFLVECLESRVLLRGQMMSLSGAEAMIFLGSPWFTHAENLLAAGLGLDDFAIHDPGTDMLLVMQAQNATVAELKQLAGTLTRQRTELRAANALLQEQNATLHNAQQALARSESEAHLLGLVAARTNNGVVITDAQGKVVWLNEGFTRITGYHLDDLRGRTPGSVLQGPLTDPATVEYMRSQLRLHQGFTAEILNYSRDQRPYWLSIEVQPIRDASGSVTHFLAIETDITSRRQAAEALQAEKDMLGTILRNIVDGVIAVDPTQRIQLLNPAAEALTGWTLDLAHSRPLHEVFQLLTPEGNPAPQLLDDAFLSRSAVGDIHGTEPRWILRAKNGANHMVVVSAHPMIRDEVTIVGGLIAFRDISPEIEADEMKRDFVSAVSHELRTPLTSIRGFLATLLGDPNIPPSIRQEFLQIIADQALRLTRLVEDILEISRIEAGQIHFEWEPIDLSETARRSLEEILPLTLRKHQRIDIRIPQHLPQVHGDPDRVRSVFSNLLANAVKFTPDHGTIGLSLLPESNHVLLTVRDTGIGIPPEMLDRVFEKFFRIRRSDSQVAGTGLGLSIVQSVVEHMGGKVEVRNVQPQGTEFRVHFPLTPPRPATPDPDPPPSSMPPPPP